MRLSGGGAFTRVYQEKVRASAGPLLIYAAPNELNHPRLGLAVPRRVGTAVTRNRIKRRLREAFRLMQHDWPSSTPGYDVVISVRPHKALELAGYLQALKKAAQSLHTAWARKQKTTPRDHTEPPTSSPDR